MCESEPDRLFRTALNLPDGTPAMVIHTFGDYAGWHFHIHVPIADGLFRKMASLQMTFIDLISPY